MENFNLKKLAMFSGIVPTILFSQVFTYQAAYKLYVYNCRKNLSRLKIYEHFESGIAITIGQTLFSIQKILHLKRWKFF